jgi:hypothetical protein
MSGIQRFMPSRSISNPEKNVSRVMAIGGSIEYVGAYKIHSFTTSGNFLLQNTGSYDNTFEILIVGGGGATGTYSGGGGAGEVVYIPSLKVNSSSNLITIGNGGVGTTAGTYTTLLNGQQSSAFGEYALGGGGGKSSDDLNNPVSANGTYSQVANGGGGSSRSAGYFGVVGTFSSASGIRYGGKRGGQISSGSGSGNEAPNYPGGGGAGAGESVSTNSGATNATSGGIGIQNSIKGLSLYWGGGGGGGTYYGGSGGNGGSGGGGAGSGGSSGGIGGSLALNSGQNGSTNVGGYGGLNTGGGGGAGRGETVSRGGDGGTGIVIIRYLDI